jgi:hypothetical protein
MMSSDILEMSAAPTSPVASEEAQSTWASQPHSFERSEHPGLTKDNIKASFALACSIVAGVCIAPEILVQARGRNRVGAANLQRRLNEGKKLLEPVLKQVLDHETVEKLLDVGYFDEPHPSSEEAVSGAVERLILQSAKLWRESEYSHLISSSGPNEYRHRHHIHELLPTIFLLGAAETSPDVRKSFPFVVVRVDLGLTSLFRLWPFTT